MRNANPSEFPVDERFWIVVFSDEGGTRVRQIGGYRQVADAFTQVEPIHLRVAQIPLARVHVPRPLP